MSKNTNKDGVDSKWQAPTKERWEEVCEQVRELRYQLGLICQRLRIAPDSTGQQIVDAISRLDERFRTAKRRSKLKGLLSSGVRIPFGG